MLKNIILSLVLLTGTLHAEIFYSYYNGKAGDIAQLEIDSQTGKITPPQTLFSDEKSFRLETIYMSDDSRYIVAQNEDDENKHLVIGNIGATPATFQKITITDRPRYVALKNDIVFAVGNQGYTHLISLNEAKVLSEERTNKEIKPSGLRAEFVTISEDGKYGVSVYMQDSPNGSARGGRVVVQDLPSLGVKYDLKLPRDHDELDFLTGSKDQGPLPQSVYLDSKSNTIIVVCRLYGAVAVADLDAVLEKGEWKNFQYIPTAPDDSFGKGFPDRAQIFTLGDKQFLYVANASKEGGVSFIDLNARKLVTHVKTGERGLNAGVFLPETQKLITTRTGFYWKRGDENLEGAHEDGKDLLVFDLSKLATTGEVALATTQWGDYVYNVSKVPGTERFVLTSIRSEKNELELVTVDLQEMKPVDRVRSGGVVRNFVSRNNP